MEGKHQLGNGLLSLLFTVQILTPYWLFPCYTIIFHIKCFQCSQFCELHNKLSCDLFYFLKGDYQAEKSPVQKHPYPPHFSFGLRTPYGKKDNNPAPNNYNMPVILGPKSVGKKSSAAFSMTSRSKIGSFHEDLQKVCVVSGGRKLQNMTAKSEDKI